MTRPREAGANRARSGLQGCTAERDVPKGRVVAPSPPHQEEESMRQIDNANIRRLNLELDSVRDDIDDVDRHLHVACYVARRRGIPLPIVRLRLAEMWDELDEEEETR
jgi:hypothetical protein